ncbi:MAG: hemolysin family protein [Planctomycetes bacterium]|nr:hemolysin family protein [Planctomycetota bacterium]MCC7398732.1 HlyC/CorC family transporter [Planctomycetota bacterium]
MLLFALAVSLSLLFSFFCSLAEATLLSVGQAHVEALAQSGSRAGHLLRRFRREPDRPIAAILVVNTIANSGGAAIATDQFSHAFPGWSPAWFAAAFVVTVLALTEIVPKTFGVVHADRLAVPIAWFVQGLVVTVAPVLLLTRALSRLFAGEHSGRTTSLEEIRVLTTLGASQGAFGPITAELIQNATRLRDTKAREIMVPRDRVAYLSGVATTESNLNLVRRTGHSRFPYTPTGDLDQVSGVILTKELLFSLRENVAPDWAELSVPVLVVPESATLNHVLRRFQRAKRHMGIVVDEYGSTRGIITLEDVLEEIVGEIEDELDTEEPSVIKRPDGSWLCRGVAEVARLFADLGLGDVDATSNTISGFMAERLGTVPTPGAHVDVGPYRFVVTKANNRRAERVRIHRLEATATDDADAS